MSLREFRDAGGVEWRVWDVRPQWTNRRDGERRTQSGASFNGPERRKLVWEIDKKLQEDGARPVIQHDWAATCWRPDVKGLNLAINTIYNHWRFEDVWLDR